MLLSGATLAHMKKKILNLNYVCSEPYRLCVTFLGSKHKLKIYSIDLKTPQNKPKSKKLSAPSHTETKFGHAYVFPIVSSVEYVLNMTEQ